MERQLTDYCTFLNLQHPMETYGYGFVFSLTGYLGVNVVLSLVKSFGALIAVTGMCLNSLHIRNTRFTRNLVEGQSAPYFYFSIIL